MFNYLKAAGAAAVSMLLVSAVVVTDTSVAVAAEEQQQTTLIAGEINVDPGVLAQLQADQAVAGAQEGADDAQGPSTDNITFYSEAVIAPVPERSQPEVAAIPDTQARCRRALSCRHHLF